MKGSCLSDLGCLRKASLVKVCGSAEMPCARLVLGPMALGSTDWHLCSFLFSSFTSRSFADSSRSISFILSSFMSSILANSSSISLMFEVLNRRSLEWCLNSLSVRIHFTTEQPRSVRTPPADYDCFIEKPIRCSSPSFPRETWVWSLRTRVLDTRPDRASNRTGHIWIHSCRLDKVFLKNYHSIEKVIL